MKLGYSTKVEVWLEAEDQSIELTHASSTHVIAKNPITLPPCDGVVIYTVDGEPVATRVRLTEGMSASSGRTQIEALGEIPAPTASSPA